MSTTQELIIKALDPHARCEYYEGSGLFGVRSNIQISDGQIISSTGAAASMPEEAYERLLTELTAVIAPKYVVTSPNGSDRRHWRWNGAAFALIEES